uniref:Uncharacterized protein n=1 Tax=Romanomermis culicivorax TaxID=13658 RepID=A0A915I6B3_ROMCU
MNYLVKQKMIESVGKTVESLLAEWRAKESHLQSTTSQGKTTPGSTTTAWPLLDPANYTIGS